MLFVGVTQITLTEEFCNGDILLLIFNN